MVTVTWASESVTVTGHTVLGWRADGVSTRYLWALVVGPTSVEVFLPPDGAAVPGAPACRWRSVAPRPGTARTGSPPIRECSSGQPPLALTTAPVLFP